ncbi:RNA polymerase sigma factor [Fimbriiglobus ruber]|uniref:Putative RNA polymerase sigma factor n=1 Tax=Fimbriiglobus ruber TaxID=1908690 RepID=A0A225D5G7_9BACT|nr:sigma-70 family RNA polymerase sigma factor [Fimbriiglobus ruber]OWK36722.1 putative RNA polymerase sigma factor [Fimbriiglobus ruber]
MPSGAVYTLLRHLRGCPPEPGGGLPSDTELLARFEGTRDEAAFEEILRRHGPLVWGVCRRVLSNRADAEDAFQATFLVLANRAGAVRKPGALGYWLYGVANRVARRMRARRVPLPLDPQSPGAVAVEARPATDAVTAHDFLAALDEELLRLPVRYQAALVHYFLREQTQDEAARSLNVSLSTLKRRVAVGREMLRTRLAGRGIDLAVLLVGVGVAGTAAGDGVRATTLAAVLAGPGAAGFVSPTVINVAEGVTKAMWRTKLRAWATGAALAAVAAGGIGYFAYTGFSQDDVPRVAKPGGQPAADAKPGAPKPTLEPRPDDDLRQSRQEKLRLAREGLARQLEVTRGTDRAQAVYEWSLRVLDAERELDPSAAGTVAAARGHLDRMKTNVALADAVFETGRGKLWKKKQPTIAE